MCKGNKTFVLRQNIFVRPEQTSSLSLGGFRPGAPRFALYSSTRGYRARPLAITLAKMSWPILITPAASANFTYPNHEQYPKPRVYLCSRAVHCYQKATITPHIRRGHPLTHVTHASTRSGHGFKPLAVSGQIGNKLSQAKRRARPFAARRAPSSCINRCYQDPGVRRGEHGFEAIRSMGSEFRPRPSAGQRGGATGASGGAARAQGDNVQTSTQQNPNSLHNHVKRLVPHTVYSEPDIEDPCYRRSRLWSLTMVLHGFGTHQRYLWSYTTVISNQTIA